MTQPIRAETIYLGAYQSYVLSIGIVPNPDDINRANFYSLTPIRIESSSDQTIKRDLEKLANACLLFNRDFIPLIVYHIPDGIQNQFGQRVLDDYGFDLKASSSINPKYHFLFESALKSVHVKQFQKSIISKFKLSSQIKSDPINQLFKK